MFHDVPVKKAKIDAEESIKYLTEELIKTNLYEIKQGLIDTLENDEWGIGSGTIDRFNSKFSKEHEAKYCLALHSGTSAIWVSLKAIGVQAGDEVIIPSYTFIATASAVILANAIPVFADINIENGNIDSSAIESLITKKTKAIIPVHMLGVPADMISCLLYTSPSPRDS